MLHRILLYLGRILFFISLLASIHSKFIHQDQLLSLCQKNYEFVQVSLRSFKILLPRPSQAGYLLEYFVYGTIGLEVVTAVLVILGKSLAGYLLIVYYGIEATLDYLIYRVGRGKNTENIFFQWQLARYVALFGISLLFTISSTKTKKPFQN